MKNVILFASIIVGSGLLLTNIYTSLVDTRSWGTDIPNSIAAAREYFKAVNPGNFFRLISPLNQVLALLALIVCWKAVPGVRLYLGIALVLYVLGDVMTFAYFYPRNDQLFMVKPMPSADVLKKIWNEWVTMNWVRSLVVLAGLVCSCFSLHKIYTQ